MEVGLLVPALRDHGLWLFLRLGAKKMVQPALRGIRMTYINSTATPDTFVIVMRRCRLVAAFA
jgi:hypothetical protein